MRNFLTDIRPSYRIPLLVSLIFLTILLIIAYLVTESLLGPSVVLGALLLGFIAASPLFKD